jgi:uncharacterized repeat protein (TIGR02543 family)
LTVDGGAGSSYYAAGTPVSIAANSAPDGQEFSNWTKEGEGSFADDDATQSPTAFTMPEGAVTLTAQYRWMAPAATIDIDYANETLSGLPEGTYTFNDGDPVEIFGTEDVVDIEASWLEDGTVSIVKKGDGATTSDSLPLVLDLPERAETPTDVKGVSETVSGENNGKITGVTEDMQYSDDGGETWKTCPEGEITGLAPGDYEVRVAAAPGDTPENSSFASLPFSVTISAGAPPAPTTYLATVNNGSGGGSYAENATVTITANAAEDGKVFDTWTGDVSFARATSASTTFIMPAKAITVTATYKDDADGDSVPDDVEQQDGTDPTDKDSYKDTDGDEVPDYVEGQDGTDPADPNSYKDTDGDGVPDYVEDQDGTDPTDKERFKDENENGIPD